MTLFPNSPTTKKQMNTPENTPESAGSQVQMPENLSPQKKAAKAFWAEMTPERKKAWKAKCDATRARTRAKKAALKANQKPKQATSDELPREEDITDSQARAAILQYINTLKTGIMLLEPYYEGTFPAQGSAVRQQRARNFLRTVNDIVIKQITSILKGL